MEPSKSDLLAIAESASQLEFWMGKNLGNNADWPIRVSGDEDSTATLVGLLTNLQNALKPYRTCSNS